MMKMNSTLLNSMLAAGAAVAVLAGCSPSKTPELHKEPNVELIQDMMEQPAEKAQDYDWFHHDQGSSRLPPEHTVPVGYKPYPYHGNAAEAAAKLKNPLAGDMSVETLTLGRTKFETYCAVCHGYQARGDGPVSVKMPLKPPPLVSEKIMKVADGAIFHIISDGQGAMSSYAYQLVNERDRWAIVNYVRSLQKIAAASGAGATANPTKKAK